MPRISAPSLPQLLSRKLYKTGQTRGADDDEIFQNRVSRNSTALIPYDYWDQWKPTAPNFYENGYIVLISPERYFGTYNIDAHLASRGLALGVNTLVFYETRLQWYNHNPEQLGWHPATERTGPLGGQYVARISATTATENGERISKGFTETSKKGAGIRVYEYASNDTIGRCRLQLEALFWGCGDSEQVALYNGMTSDDIVQRRQYVVNECQRLGLLNFAALTAARMLNAQGKTICPLCLEELSAQGFFSRMEQAQGRAVLDLTITQLNLFHIEELRLGEWNHRPYNLGWGHHHCNVVVKDAGISQTLQWMQAVINRNAVNGYSFVCNSNNGI